MNTTAVMDSKDQCDQDTPGLQLARIREKKGFTKEYVAVKLHLRVRVIELLESDDYENLPEPVFIKGYLRAYAKLLGVHPDPYLEIFNELYTLEKKPEKALWQSRRESHAGERVVRWVTGLVAITIIVAVSFWWQKNKDDQNLFNTAAKDNKVVATMTTPVDKKQPEPKLSALSKLQSMFTMESQVTPVEKPRD
jgi:cytoskeleton protein RodZ